MGPGVGIVDGIGDGVGEGVPPGGADVGVAVGPPGGTPGSGVPLIPPSGVGVDGTDDAKVLLTTDDGIYIPFLRLIMRMSRRPDIGSVRYRAQPELLQACD